MIENHDLHLSGTFRNIELAIIEAIHLLSPLSEYQDESCRCKDIYNLVKDASIQIDGSIQQKNIRFPLFSSALSGRRTSFHLFEKITDKDRYGSWWKLKTSYEDAISFANSIHTKNSTRFPSSKASLETSNVVASREEIVRSMFLSMVPATMKVKELSVENERLQNKHDQLKQELQTLKSESSTETLRLIDQIDSLQQNLNEIIQHKTTQQDISGYHHPLQFFS